MSGYCGYRTTGDFIAANSKELLRHFKPHKDRLPNFDTIRRLLIALDFGAFSAAFYQWAKTRVKLKQGGWLAIDSKAIGGTLSGLRASHQQFIMLVSLYCLRAGLSLGMAKMDNGKQSEGAVVRTLIEALDIEGVVFTLDALHMPSLCVVTAGVKVFKDLYERIYERTGMKMKGYVAVQKKLLTTMYALWRRNEAFDPEYGQQLSAAAISQRK